MSIRFLKWVSVLLPTFIIGAFELVRHEFLEELISMKLGNFLLLVLTFLIFYLFATWMFRTIQQSNKRITKEQSRQAIYEERERIARELHDKIAQILFFLNVMLKQRKLEEAKSAVSELDQHVRHAIFNLRSNHENNSDFSSHLSKWLDEWSITSGIDVKKQITITNQFTTREEIELFSIIQEAFINIRKHSKATLASISFVVSKKEWTLVIKDDGIGIKKESHNPNKYGLSFIKKRVKDLNASFTIDNKSTGTEIIIKGST